MKLRRSPRLLLVLTLLLMGGIDAAALDIINKYRSPRNRERAPRKSTEFIVLHTTEGSEKGALAKLQKNGEAHYCVGLDGKIYSIVDMRKTAYHAGVSMWNGRTELDRHSIGIEIVGTHKTEIRAAQYKAVNALIEYLQGIYKVPDDRVLPHSMVAYGKPNPWHKKNHRGRKRCGMLFARDSVRAKLGLSKRPAYDPDVKAGRLVIGDSYLASILFGFRIEASLPVEEPSESTTGVISKGKTPWDVAGDAYNSSTTIYIFPDGTKKRGNQIKDWKRIPIGTRVVVM